MKKYIPYVIVVLLVILIGGELTYIVLSDKKENTKSSTKKPEDSINHSFKLLNTEKKTNENSEEQLIQKYELTLNNQVKNIEIAYTYKYHEANEFDEAYEEVIGMYNNEEVFYNFEITSTSNKDTKFTSEFINNNFNSKNFHIIKGTDNKEYFGISTNKNYGLSVIPSNVLYIYNENFEQIINNIPGYGGCAQDNFLTILGGATAYQLEDNSKWYEDVFNVCSDDENIWCHIGVKLTNDKIYYLTPQVDNYNALEDNFGTMEEREYTINNNKLEYKTINTYKIVDGAGQIC